LVDIATSLRGAVRILEKDMNRLESPNSCIYLLGKEKTVGYPPRTLRFFQIVAIPVPGAAVSGPDFTTNKPLKGSFYPVVPRSAAYLSIYFCDA